MERKLYAKLRDWKERPGRKPLLLHGVRQAGKTFLLQQFGGREFSRVHYVNFEKNKNIHSLFERDLDPRRIIKDLELHLEHFVDIENDLLILDEIQACPNALTSLKYFCEDLPELAVASAGSLLGLHLGGVSFPVGKVDNLTLFPMSFEEFLMALKDEKGLAVFREISQKSPPSTIAHDYLWERLKEYFVVGGMPEVIRLFRDNRENIFRAMEAVRVKQDDLVLAYLADMAKHSGKENAMHLERVWRSVVQQLGQTDNDSVSKFRFRGVVPGISHYSRLAGAIDWLLATGLVHKTHITNLAQLPLSAYTKENTFKLYLFDVGILGSLAGIKPKTILDYDYGSYKGFFAENFVAQEFLCSGMKNLFSWQEGRLEVEFLLEDDGRVIPVEVKSGSVIHAKSLSKFIHKYHPPHRLIISARPLRIDDVRKIKLLPLYLAGRVLEQ